MPLSLQNHLKALESGDYSAESYAGSLIERIEAAKNDGAFISYDAQALMAEAQASDERRKSGQAGALDGAFIGVKDNIDTSGLPTTGGTRGLTAAAADNAPPLQRLLDQGVVVAGKTNLHELAFGITSNNGVFGPVRNPADRNMIAGGSSGGTAAAIAAGIVPAGLGSDTGGSSRIPAALCGVVGFRPSSGRYPSGGVVPLSSTRDTIGPMGSCVADVTLLDAVMAGEGRTADGMPSAADLRIAVPRRVLWDNLEPAVSARCEATLEALAKAGVALIETDPEDLWEDDAAASFPIVLYETMAELPAYLEGRGVAFAAMLDAVGSPDVRGVLESQLGAEKMPEAAYQAALTVHRPNMQKNWAAWFEANQIDAAIFPTTPLTARPIGHDETVELNGEQVPTFPTYIRNTDHGSVIGAPGLSLPTAGDGLPVGIELDGAVGSDRRLLQVAACVEAIINR